MRFHADLHIHSKYSRATSRDLDLEHLAAWGARKGIAVVATGDFTHPAWRAELKAKLVPAEPGLFRLRPEIAREVLQTVPAACQAAPLPQFMLAVEISTIYKKGDRTRKVHHLIYAPDFETADRFSASLARIGNITSDGRPILGLDSRHLLEIALESGPDAYLIPAHIWTPWFAALGSQSGFDSIAECYGDLADRIFAVETGLSSDPSMNWRLSQLDRFRLVSNSDAHSPGKLGREATMFACAQDYYAIRRALETGEGYVGTVEFFPEEGKYHHDGHRKCGVRHTPAETLAHGGRCPVCGQLTTVGVLHRVVALADRSEAEAATPPATAGEVASLVPLPEVIAELSATGAASKTVERSYDRLVSTMGAELWILEDAPLEDIARGASSLLAEAIARLRAGRVIREAGYDGEYGVIRLFEEAELRQLTAGGLLFGTPSVRRKRVDHPHPNPLPEGAGSRTGALGHGAGESSALAHGVPTPGGEAHLLTGALPPMPLPPHFPTKAQRGAGGVKGMALAPSGLLAGLDDDQRAAAATVDGPLLIVAGPGSGKTRTLTHRIAHLIAERGAPASACLAITFTRRAAAEMRERLATLLPANADRVPIHTFHSLGLTILREHAAAVNLPRDFRVASEEERVLMLAGALGLSEARAATTLRAISKAKRTNGGAGAPSDDLTKTLDAYREALAARAWIDFDDLVGLAVQAVASVPDVSAWCRDRFRWICVDEFQDVDEQQYRLLTLLAPPPAAPANLCVIGDPNQAIYGFRGADASCFERFAREYPGAASVHLTRNYRSTGTIVAASSQVIAAQAEDRPLADLVRDMHERITIHVAPTDRAEAEFVVRTIETLMGGHSLVSIDSGRATRTGATANTGFADFAVLYRTDAQSAALCHAFSHSGIPFKRHSHDRLTDQPVVRALLRALRHPTPRLPLEIDPIEPAAGTASPSDGILLWDMPVTEEPSLADRLRIAADDVSRRDDAPDVAARELALQQLLRLAETCGGHEGRFADALALATEADFWDPRADRVSLLTVHAAKGLEFPIVFIAGLEDGILPLYWNELDPATAAEERRLFYVGMTRAKDRLVLARATERFWRGRVRALPASTFLDDIEHELLRHQRSEPARVKPDDRQLRLLD
jgi:DNA helicase II / ATP-dependent DNA helicase PcrA